MKILLHICCAPCAIKPIEKLREDGHEVTGFWYNPNIHPFGEWRLRREGVEKLAEIVDLPVIYDDHYDLVDNLYMLLKEPEFQVRCFRCYWDRLERTARTAAEKDFDAFSTTLLYSKYQMHDTIRRVAGMITREEWVNFYYDDFRVFWGRGIKASKKLGLYRQTWCGCIFSEYEAERERMERSRSKQKK